VGAGAVAAGTGGLLQAPPAAASPYAHMASAAQFGRMFPKLAPFAQPTAAMTKALMQLGEPGGLMDAHDELHFGARTLFLPEDYGDLGHDLAASLNNRNNAAHTAGTTFFLQFVAHDISFDATSPLGVATAPEQVANARNPAFDLDSIYGAGPVAAAHLYDSADPIKLRVESGGTFEDVPRGSDMGAVIADPRNDTNCVVSALHAAFILFHNNAVDHARASGLGDMQAFEDARRLTRWHYQWLLVNEFLPLLVSKQTLDAVRKGRKFYKGGAIPVEFSGAAFRFGHSMVRPSYRLNMNGLPNGEAFFSMMFDPLEEGKADPEDMRGGVRAARRWIGWETFFDFGDGVVRPPKRIDTKISSPMFKLPLQAIPQHGGPTSIVQRDLLRHFTWRLPSGQAVAKAMGVHVLAAHDLKELQIFGQKLERATPLWYYLLKESELAEGGIRLGPTGGRIVAEVMLGLLEQDPTSYVKAQPDWKPTFARDGKFETTDFLRFAGVDPASRGR
jgi:hypothetical protein